LGFAVSATPSPACVEDPVGRAAFLPTISSRKTAFVDFQHDVTEADIALAHREGFTSVEHLKRYTTLGMATDQGRLANVGGIALMAALTGRAMGETGTTIYRPPHVPVAIANFAGHHRGKDFHPTRLTPSHAWAVEQGAVFVETGLWLRAQWYPQPGETDWLAIVSREVMTVRGKVGVCDVSTFGKIDIQGPDAGTFLDRVYINTISTLPVGKVRYGVMQREDGFVMDDGTVARLAPGHFVMTTTTANAGPVMQHLEFCRQVVWPSLDVQLASVSEQWAQFSVAGPRARDVLAKLVDEPFDLSNEAFPYLAASSLKLCGGVPGRLFRVSFSGELAYEIAVPADHGDALIRAIMAAGQEFGIVPYGTEALGVMRIEKGHVAGNELNGHTTARDLGLGRMIATRKDHIGRRLAERPALVDPDRPSVVGFRPVDGKARLSAGAHFLAIGAAAVAANDEGYMTSVAYSPSLGHWIGLGLLARGAQRIGERLRAYDPVRGNDIEVEICRPSFVDPEGVRLHA
jgi:sarcosine oxidase subunit alpha